MHLQIMWFSSGGTKSVVHTDSVENINCLYSGEKEFVMVDPFKYKNMVSCDGSNAQIYCMHFNYKYTGMWLIR